MTSVALMAIAVTLIVSVYSLVHAEHEIDRLSRAIRDMHSSLEGLKGDLHMANHKSQEVAPTLPPLPHTPIPVRDVRDVLVLENCIAYASGPMPDFGAEAEPRERDIAKAQDEAFRIDAEQDTETFFRTLEGTP